MKNNVLLILILLFISIGAFAKPLDLRLNTANNIRAAWELRRLSESLAPGVDTRCFIAKLAAFKAESMPKSAEVISQYMDGSNESDKFAIQSINEAMEIFRKNEVLKIKNKCKSNGNS